MNIIEKVINKNISRAYSDFRISCRLIDRGNTVEKFELNPNKKCHLASVCKLFALVGVLYLSQNHVLNLETKYILTDEDIIEGQFILGNLHPGIELTLLDLTRLMVVGYDTFAYDIIFNNYLDKDLNRLFKKFGLFNTNISYSILDINLILSNLYNTENSAKISWGSLFDNIPDVLDEAIHLDINEYNYSTVGDISTLFDKLINCKILNAQYWSIAEDILLSQYDATRIPAKLPDKLASSVGHQIGTITDGESYQVINDCGFIKLSSIRYLVLNFFCCNIRDSRTTINDIISSTTSEIVDAFS